MSHIEIYEKNGVLKVENLLTADEVNAVREALARYTQHIVPDLPESDYVLEANGSSVRNMWRMEQHDAFFAELAQRSSITALLAPLLHGAPVLMAVETFNKPSRVGSGVPPHQDNAYFCMTPPDVLTVWIAIDSVTNDNGPITYIPGSHKGGIRPHEKSGVSGNSMGIMESLKDEETYTSLLNPGDALIHHCETIHFSGPNKSDNARCGLLLVYRAEHCQTDTDLKQAY